MKTLFRRLYLDFYFISRSIGDKINVKADKVMHFISCFVITLVAGLIWGAEFGIAAGVLAGVAKEIYDHWQPNNYFCWRDIQADLLGIIAASLLFL